MDRKIKKYERFLRTLLTNYVAERATRKDSTYQLVIDNKNHHLQVIRNGWDDDRLIHHFIFHFEIKSDGKIWIWVNKTDMDLGQELRLKGIPNSDIVLGFHPPYLRDLSDYAVN
jgi:hypothetical protein